MDFLGDLIRGMKLWAWLSVFGAWVLLILLAYLVPLREVKSLRTRGGGTASYTFIVSLRAVKIFAILMAIVAFIGLMGKIMGLWENQTIANWAGFFMALAVICSIPSYKIAQHYLRGSEGEGAVERELEKLPQGFFIFHDISTGRGNVDHLVVGPTGIFTIETKRWKGSPKVKDGYLYVGGQSCYKPLNQAFAEAMAIRDYLIKKGFKPFVTPILCFFQRVARGFKEKIKGVWVLGLDQVISFIQSQPPSLPNSKFIQIREALEELKAQEKFKGQGS